MKAGRLYVGDVPFVTRKTSFGSDCLWTRWLGSDYFLFLLLGLLIVAGGVFIAAVGNQKHYFTWSAAVPGICVICVGLMFCIFAWYLAGFWSEVRLDTQAGEISWESRFRHFRFAQERADLEQVDMYLCRVEVSTHRKWHFWSGYVVLLESQKSRIAIAAVRKEAEIDSVLEKLEWPFDIDRSRMDEKPMLATGSPAWLSRKL